MKQELKKFTCDFCNKEEIRANFKGYPYDVKWVYLYSFEFKLKNNFQNKNIDKHFCSVDCLKNFILKKIEDKKNE